VRINPATDKVSAVVHAPVDPVVAASSDRRVWLYSDSGTISEFDPRTNRVVKKAAASLVRPAECCSVYSGPVLAADASGAWFVTGRLPGKGMLVRVPVQGRKRKYPLPVTPTGVGVGDGFVWIVGHTPRGGEVLRVNPADGRVTARRRFAASALVNSIAFGFHHVWVASAARSMLYRLDPQLRLRPISVHVADSHITRPELIAGDVWIRVNDAKGTTRWFDPSSLKKIHTESDGPPSYEEYAWNGSLWWYDQPSGSVYRQNGEGASIEQIQVTRSLPAAGGPCLRSIATVGGEVWVTVGSSVTPDAYVCGA
jgi:hypothetical protein